MTSSKTLVKHLRLYWIPKAILLFFWCCYMAHYKIVPLLCGGAFQFLKFLHDGGIFLLS